MINLRNLASAALALAALLSACGGQNVPIDAELSVTDFTAVYDGQPQMPEITFDPPGAEIGAEVVVTPEGAPALEAGTWPTDAGVYAVVVRASADQGGREAEGTLTIAPRPIDVAPAAGQGKVFGTAEPALAYAFVDPAGEAIVPSSASGGLGREAGESLGTYAFTLGDLDAGANFVLALEDDAATFTVAASELGDGGIVVTDATVTFDGADQSVDVSFDPPAAGVGAVVTYGELEAGVLPVDAGTYAVTAVAAAGYVGTATGTLVIAPRPIDVAPAAGQGKVFGAPEPALAYAFVDPAGEAIVPSSASGGLGREAGESLGTYAFTLGDLDAGANFVLALEDDAATFTVAASELGDGGIVVTDATVTFDGADQSVDVSFDPPAAGVGAVVTYGELEAGVLPVNAGTYDVTVVAGPGYVGGANGTLTILARPVNLVPNADQGKVYGDEEPTYGYGFVDPSGEGVLPTAATGALGRDAGENVGSYDFTIGDVDAGANYAVTLTAASLEIAPRPLTVSGFAVDGKTYDGTTAASGADFLDDRLAGDDVVVGFDVAFASSDVGASVVANFTGLEITGGADAGNYVLATTSGSATAAIARRALSVTNVLWADKVYDGGTGATASATLVTADVVDGDAVQLVASLVGEFASDDVGTHAVVGSFLLTGADAANYVVEPQPTGSADIDVRPVALDDAALEAKTYDGTAIASVTGTLRAASGFDSGVLPADVAGLGFAGAFAQSDAAVDLVAVTVSLTGGPAGNYVLDPVPALSGAIAPAEVTVTPDANQSKVYGNADPDAFGFDTAGLVGDDATTGALVRVDGETVGSYAFELGTLDAGGNYALVLADEAATFAITTRPITLTAAATSTVYGESGDLTAALAEGSSLRVGDVLAGDLARPERGVGDYAFELGSATLTRDAADVAGNYTVAFATYAVTTRPLTITADDADKTYGDPLDLGSTAFTASANDVGTGLAGAEVVTAVTLVSSGTAGTATVADGPYAIVASDAVGGEGFDLANYAITYVPGSLTVEPRLVTLSGTFSVAEKAYDGSAEAGTVDVSGLVLNNLADGDDVAIEVVATFADELVGDGKLATLTMATLTGADAGNYSVSLAGAPTTTGTVVKADIAFGITIAGTDFATEVVYDGDRTFQPNVTTTPDPVPSDVPVAYDVEITYDPTGGSVGSFNPVGTYTVTVTAADPRYVGSSTQVVEVLARPITIASSVIVKSYGTLDPAMFPSLADGTTFGRGEAFFVSGALTYRPGDQATPYAVGTYPLDLGSVAVYRGEHQDVTTNYAITFASGFEIEPAIVTVTPAADQGKVYGDADLVFGYATEGLLNEDALSGVLEREPGEDVGAYAFTLGELSGGANYTLVLADAPATYTIIARPLTLTTAFPEFTYGDTDLDLAAVIAEGSTLREGDALTGELALSNTDAGSHAFLLGTVALTGDGGDVASNYALAFTDYTMAPRSATVTPLADQGKTYGDADPVLGFTADLLDGDVLTGALGRDAGEDVGTYAFSLGDLANANYVLALGEDAPAFAITPRPITLEATVASKEFSTVDPDLSPTLAAGSSLRVEDGLVGALAYVGSDVGSYPLELGSVQVLRGEVNVAANYSITLGAFTIDPLPVTFDLANADLVLAGAPRTHVFFGDGSEPIRGLTVAVTPEGATPNFRFSYLWTHDADHVAFASPIAVQRIQGLGTYQVTVTATATSANHVGASTLTVWVTDATGVAFAEPAYDALVGATVTTVVRLVGPDGTPRTAGPVPIAVDLVSDAAHVGFATDGAPASSTTVAIASGATASEFGVVAVALGSVPAGLTATVSDASAPGLASGAATFATTAQLVVAPGALDVGAGATTAPVAVRLEGSAGLPVLAPADLRVDLTSDPAGVVFRDAADTADVVFVTIPTGASEASFRMRAETPATYAVVAAHDGSFTGVASGLLDVTVAPRPTVSSIEPATVAKAQTIDLALTGVGFADGVVVSFSGDDVTVDSVTVDSATQLTVRVTIAATTDVGMRDVTVTNLDGGASTTEGALTLTVPTLTASDDGPFGVVEGGNRALSIASDLLANDSWGGTTSWGFDGVVSATGVTYGVAGDVLTLTAPADAGGSTASLTYRVRDAVFGTSATATVAIDVTLAPVDAILFTEPLEFEDFRTTEYTVPTFADVFASWPRFDGASYFTSSPYSTNAGAWYLDGGTVVQPTNVSPGVGFVSPDAFEYFTFESTLYAGGFDNDSIGLVAAFGRPDGSNVGLVAHRTTGGNAPYGGWGLSLLQGSSYQVLAEPTVDAFTASGDWQGRASRVKVERIGDIVRIQATDWFYENVATAAPAYDPQSLIVLDLATGVVTYRSGSSFVDVTLASTQRATVAKLQGPQSYGYYTYSQPDSRYYNTAFEGGAARDTAILLTGFDGTAYTGSQVWRFAEGWAQVAGRTIQQELGAPRDVTSVASPNPGSAYPGGYAVLGDRFRIESTTVVPIVD